jgi:predicted GIY-YIG superfamily endonuclease
MRTRNKINNKGKKDNNFNTDNFIKVPIFTQKQKYEIQKEANRLGFKNINVIKNSQKNLTDLAKIPKNYKRGGECNKCKMDKKLCDANHVVYKMSCKYCNKFYIGMTNNTMCNRITQHKYQWQKSDTNNAISLHFQKEHPSYKPNIENININIIKREKNNILTAISESKLIYNLKPELNRKQELSNNFFI